MMHLFRLGKKRENILDQSYDFMRILYMQPQGIGDIIMSTPIFRALKEKYPGCILDVMTMEHCQNILEGNPHIDHILPWDETVDTRYYTQVLRPYIATQRISGWHKRGIHIVDLYAFECGIELTNYKSTIYPIAVDLSRYGIHDDEPFIVMHTNSPDKAKNWPSSYFQDLITRLKEHAKIIIVDTNPRMHFSHARTIENDLSLREIAYIIGKSSLFIGIDSMAMHMAAALDVPAIALYGNTIPELCRPLAAAHFIAIEPPHRNGCASGCHDTCTKERLCIPNISVAMVYEKTQQFLPVRQYNKIHV